MHTKRTIYLADDDDDDRMLLTEAIKVIDTEMTIIEADNGAELLDILKNNNPGKQDLVILDINMYMMNGIETLAKLKDFPFMDNVPVVMLSTSKNSNMVAMARQLGVNEYFIKPTTFQGLLTLARQFALIGK